MVFGARQGSLLALLLLPFLEMVRPIRSLAQRTPCDTYRFSAAETVPCPHRFARSFAVIFSSTASESSLSNDQLQEVTSGCLNHVKLEPCNGGEHREINRGALRPSFLSCFGRSLHNNHALKRVLLRPSLLRGCDSLGDTSFELAFYNPQSPNVSHAAHRANVENLDEA
jgi:hypothetical protein